MTLDEHKTLGLLLYRLAETFRAKLTDATVRGYCRALDDLPIQALRRAVDRAERESARFPSPFELRKLLRPDESGGERRRGTYPPDIAARRRQLGLPVTAEEHAAYARGEEG